MFKNIFSFKIFGSNLGIDLGTTNTIIYAEDKGIVLDAPSVLAVSQNDGRIMGIGKEAKEMIGKTPKNILAVRPLQDGVIADFDIAQKMVEYFISQVQPHRPLIGPQMVIGVPSKATEVERKAIVDIAAGVGARKTHLVAESVAAVIGADLPLSKPSGNMIVDIGGGSSETAVISLNGVVISHCIRIAGDEMDRAIIQYLREAYNLLIGEQMAERIKITIGDLSSNKEEKIKVRGRNLATGFPYEMEVNSKEIGEVLFPPVSTICDMIETTLEETPPELSGDIMQRGIYLTGGGACIKGLDAYISKRIHLLVNMVAQPLLSVALGTGKLLKDQKLLSAIEITPPAD